MRALAVIAALHASSYLIEDEAPVDAPPNLRVGDDVHRWNHGGSLLLKRAFGKLSFNKPVRMLQAAGDDTTWYVVEQNGRIVRFANRPDVRITATFIDITKRVNSLPTGCRAKKPISRV